MYLRCKQNNTSRRERFQVLHDICERPSFRSHVVPGARKPIIVIKHLGRHVYGEHSHQTSTVAVIGNSAAVVYLSSHVQKRSPR